MRFLLSFLHSITLHGAQIPSQTIEIHEMAERGFTISLVKFGERFEYEDPDGSLSMLLIAAELSQAMRLKVYESPEKIRSPGLLAVDGWKTKHSLLKQVAQASGDVTLVQWIKSTHALNYDTLFTKLIVPLKEKLKDQLFRETPLTELLNLLDLSLNPQFKKRTVKFIHVRLSMAPGKNN